MSIDFTTIEKWYSGKALDVIRSVAVPTLRQAEQEDAWPTSPPRISMKVKAALKKMTVAQSFAKKHEYRFGALSTEDRRFRGFEIYMAMQYGILDPGGVDQIVTKLRKQYVSVDDTALLDTAAQWARDFMAVAALVERLDATRPKPVIVMGTLSPTVLANVGRSLGVDLKTIRMPEIVWTYAEMMIKGKKLWIPSPEIRWPKGTKHNRSRFAGGSAAGNAQCHACGHVIRCANNWVPLLCDTPQGPSSLWVGRDCAHKLFNVDVRGAAFHKR